MIPGTPEQAASLLAQQPAVNAPEEATATTPAVDAAVPQNTATSPAVNAPEEATAITPSVDAAVPQETATVPAPDALLPTLAGSTIQVNPLVTARNSVLFLNLQQSSEHSLCLLR